MRPILKIHCGDCRDILKTYLGGAVQCCVTSPPYWGLRDYGTAQWEGGDEGCDHKPPTKNSNGRDRSGLTGSLDYVECQEPMYKAVCHCGARRIDSQLGLESTPEEYVAKMVGVFREVWRVLRDDGTLWLNMGDSYATSNPAGRRDSGNGTSERFGNHEITGSFGPITRKQAGLKPKDLCGIPWRLAFALQADGWYLRSDIIWAKPNPMPESVTDRPTKSHEYIFLLSKSERYFYDAEAIRELTSEKTIWTYPQPDKAARAGLTQNGTGESGLREYSNGFRNKRTVWTISTQPYAEAHFATFPEDLIKPCILAGSRLGDAVLDPFAGSGTTGAVAIEFGRRAILIELNPEYVAFAKDRCDVTPGFL